MKLVLIDGGPASGKNTLGEILVDTFTQLGEKAILLDHDTYVEDLCPDWKWENTQQKELDLFTARQHFTAAIVEQIEKNTVIIAIGVRLFAKQDVEIYTRGISNEAQVYLFHLDVPFTLREERLRNRGPHSLINLAQDQADRDTVRFWPGYVYPNIHSPEEDAQQLFTLIQNSVGLIT